LNNSMFAKAAIWMVIALVLFTVFSSSRAASGPVSGPAVSEFLAEVSPADQDGRDPRVRCHAGDRRHHR